MNNHTQVTPEVSDYQSFIASKLNSISLLASPRLIYPAMACSTSKNLSCRGRSSVAGRRCLPTPGDSGVEPSCLAWADQVCQHTQKPALILAPLCVAQQTVREANRMGIPDVA